MRAIRVVWGGGVYFDPLIAGQFLGPSASPARTRAAPAELSEREAEVLRLVALGHSNKVIAAQLEVAGKTAETYKARAMEKLALRSRVDIVRYAIERGWMREV